MSNDPSSAYALGARTAARRFDLQKIALAGTSTATVSAPKVPSVGGLAAPKANDPTTAGIGNTLTHNGLANDTFSDAQAHTPAKVAAAHAEAMAKHAGILGLVAKAPAAIAGLSKLPKAGVATAVGKNVAGMAASSAVSSAGDAAGRAL